MANLFEFYKNFKITLFFVVKMAKKTKRKWAPTWAFFSNAPPLVLFCQNQNQRRGLNQLEFFLQLVARPVLGGGGL